ncbi:LysR family transcriptional regulator [Denitrobaculum tricleocarpae]|nr:LysR family transcriptional regulator [Denitrobaculum tricleocarpae]
MNWDDVRVFCAVARLGTLSAAARELKLSQPTVGRRIQSLEESLSARLFDKRPDGFVLAPAGIELLPLAEQMTRSADVIQRRRDSFSEELTGTLRISTPEQMAMFLTEQLPDLRAALPEIEWEVAVSHVQVNLTRREADLLIRECLPENSSLISRKLGRVAYAVYGAHDYVERFPQSRTDARFDLCDWVGYDEAHAHFGSQKWLDKHRDRTPETRTNNGLVLVEAVRRGCGLAVLPCYAAETVTGLQRVSPVIPELVVDQWLLVHRDLLRTPRVRAAIDVIVELFKRHERRLLGS